MKKDSTDPLPQNPLSDEDKRLLRRRRLLKSLAAGAPALLTLKSGAALAQSSNMTLAQCITADVDNQNPTYSSYGNTRCWDNADSANNKHVTVPETSALTGSQNMNANAPASDVDTSDYCLLYVDSSGTPASDTYRGATGTELDNTLNTGSYYVVLDSCWTSFSSN
ncbi:MAG: hypothetical protein HQL54_12720 [Magnetococcales bacterium]|nr:hypothetical protein [Magnetococcales bacterium]